MSRGAAPAAGQRRRRQRGLLRRRPARRVRQDVHGVPARRRPDRRPGDGADERPLRRHLRRHDGRPRRRGDGGRVTFRLFADTPGAVATSPSRRPLRLDAGHRRRRAARSRRPGRAGRPAAYRLGAPPAAGAPIRLVGVPVAGVAATDWFLRGATCTAGPATRLVEWEWLWDAATSSDCAGILPAARARRCSPPPTRPPSSASSTPRRSGPTPGSTCSLGQPCEVRPTASSVRTARTPCPRGLGGVLRAGVGPAAPGCPAEQPPVGVDAPLRAVRPAPRGTPPSARRSTAGRRQVRPARHDGLPGRRRLRARRRRRALRRAAPAGRGRVRAVRRRARRRRATDHREAGSAVMQVDATPPDQPITLARRRRRRRCERRAVFAPPEYPRSSSR